MKIFWGFVLVVIGFTYLGAGLNWWGYEAVNTLWQFWPLILVFWGLELLTKNTNFYIPVMIIAVILSGAMIYIGIYNQTNSLDWFGSRGGSNIGEAKRSEITADIPAEAKTAKVKVRTGAVDFRIDGSTKKLVEGYLDSSFTTVEVAENMNGTEALVDLSTVGESANSMWMMGVRNFKNLLSLKLTKLVPVALDVKSGASSLDFDLREVKLSGLYLETGASSLVVKVGSDVLDGAKLDVSAGASSLDFTFPQNIGVKIVSESGLTSRDFKGYTARDGAWYSAGYDTAEKKIELNLRVGASSITVGN